MRPDNPALTIGYIIQTQMDTLMMDTLIKTNSEIITALGTIPTASTINVYGHSGGSIISEMILAT